MAQQQRKEQVLWLFMESMSTFHDTDVHFSTIVSPSLLANNNGAESAPDIVNFSLKDLYGVQEIQKQDQVKTRLPEWHFLSAGIVWLK